MWNGLTGGAADIDSDVVSVRSIASFDSAPGDLGGRYAFRALFVGCVEP
jgi:hypothetical protein